MMMTITNCCNLTQKTDHKQIILQFVVNNICQLFVNKTIQHIFINNADDDDED